MSVLLIVGPKCVRWPRCMLFWRVRVSMPTGHTVKRTDPRTPDSYTTLTAARGQRNKIKDNGCPYSLMRNIVRW